MMQGQKVRKNTAPHIAHVNMGLSSSDFLTHHNYNYISMEKKEVRIDSDISLTCSDLTLKHRPTASDVKTPVTLTDVAVVPRETRGQAPKEHRLPMTVARPYEPAIAVDARRSPAARLFFLDREADPLPEQEPDVKEQTYRDGGSS